MWEVLICGKCLSICNTALGKADFIAIAIAFKIDVSIININLSERYCSAFPQNKFSWKYPSWTQIISRAFKRLPRPELSHLENLHLWPRFARSAYAMNRQDVTCFGSSQSNVLIYDRKSWGGRTSSPLPHLS